MSGSHSKSIYTTFIISRIDGLTDPYEILKVGYLILGWPTSLRRQHLLFTLWLHGFESLERLQREWTLGWAPAQNVPQ